MGLIQFVIIIILIAIIIFGFAAVFDFSKGVVRNIYPELIIHNEPFITGNVTKVIDGDTLDIETKDRIRLAIIDTPERGQLGYEEAKQWTTDHCLGKNAIVDVDDAQPLTYGRIVGLVYCGDDAYFANLGLLQQHLAVVIPHFCKFSEFKGGVLCHQ